MRRRSLQHGERRELLAEALAKVRCSHRSRSTPSLPSWSPANELGLEDIIASPEGSIYEPGRRSESVAQHKIYRSQGSVIGGPWCWSDRSRTAAEKNPA